MLVDPIEEGQRVRGEIQAILYPDQIKHIRALGLWCAHTHTHAHTHTRTRTNALSSPRGLSLYTRYVHPYIHTQVLTFSHTHTHLLVHARTNTNTNTNTQACVFRRGEEEGPRGHVSSLGERRE